MNLFIPISILAYALQGVSVLIAKAQLETSLPRPIAYAFYGTISQLLAILLIPFGFTWDFSSLVLTQSFLAGITFFIAVVLMMQGIKDNEASVAGPVIGALNPLFALIIGWIFLGQVLTANQTWAVVVLIIGAVILTLNNWIKGIKTFKYNFLTLVLSGALYGLSYVFLREVFLHTSFINGLVLSRIAVGICALTLLTLPSWRTQIFSKPKKENVEKTSLVFVVGQIAAGISNLLIFYAVSLANPAIVNSFFGIQYIIILIAAILLFKKHPKLLDEDTSKKTISLKIVGILILSCGLYLIAT